MLVIFGTQWKYKRKSGGKTKLQMCPGCKRDSEFYEVVPTRYITLYFIPLIPVGSQQGSYYECPFCHKVFQFY